MCWSLHSICIYTCKYLICLNCNTVPVWSYKALLFHKWMMLNCYIFNALQTQLKEKLEENLKSLDQAILKNDRLIRRYVDYKWWIDSMSVWMVLHLSTNLNICWVDNNSNLSLFKIVWSSYKTVWENRKFYREQWHTLRQFFSQTIIF